MKGQTNNIYLNTNTKAPSPEVGIPKPPMLVETEAWPVRAASRDGVLVAVAGVTVLVSGEEKKPGPRGGGLT